MKRRRFLATAAAAAFSRPHAISAQPRPSRIGFLHPGDAAYADVRIEAFREGFVAARGASPNVEIVARVADNRFERLPALASELVAAGVQAICPVSPPAVLAARAVARSLPIVALDLESDPVADGWVESLARPGGTLTGIFLDFPDFTAKCLQILGEAVGGLSTVAVLWHPSVGRLQLQAAEAAASRMAIALRVFEVGTLDEIEPAFAAMRQAGMQGVAMLSSPLFGGNLKMMSGLVARHRLPAINQFPKFAASGGLLGYGPELESMFRQLGALTRRTLEAGTGAASYPVERPVRFKLGLNAKTAAMLGLDIPPTLLARADEVIE